MKKIDQSIWVFQLPSGLEVRLVNVPQEDLDFLGGIDRLRQRVQELTPERNELLKTIAIAEPVMDAHAGPSRLADFHAAIASVKEKA